MLYPGDRKLGSLSITIVIIAILAILVLVVLVVIFGKGINPFAKAATECQLDVCAAANGCEGKCGSDVTMCVAIPNDACKDRGGYCCTKVGG